MENEASKNLKASNSIPIKTDNEENVSESEYIIEYVDDCEEEQISESNGSQNDEEFEINPSTSFNQQCLSPPKHFREEKKGNLKNKSIKSQIKAKKIIKKRKSKPKLVNSASNVKLDEENLNITDSLTELQDKINVIQSEPCPNEVSKSEPSTANIEESKLKAKTFDSGYNYWKSKSEVAKIEPTEREEMFKKIVRLLRLALKNNSNQSSQPVYSHYRKNSDYTTPPIPTSNTSNLIDHTFMKLSYQDNNEQSPKKITASNIWKEIFDYFVYYNDRAETSEEIDKRLEQVRSEIPKKIENILNTNYIEISSQMEYDVKLNMKTPADYSFLYEHKIYTDQLCYLYWLVEDLLNEIGYIESLYPSQKLLKENQPDYDDLKFESTSKTLLLWYKIMKDLMLKCDQLGRYLGFAKRPENLEYWTWFDQRLNYSRTEYERVQKWLNTSLSANLAEIPTSSTLTDHKSTAPSQVTSPSIMLTKPTFSDFNQVTDLLNFSKTSYRNRQISFLLKNSKTQSLIQDIFSPSVHLNDLATENTNEISNKSNLSSFSVISEQERISPELFTSTILKQDDPLIRVKLAHLNSFILNRSSSMKTESTNNGSSTASSEKVVFSLADELCSSSDNLNQEVPYDYDKRNLETPTTSSKQNRLESDLYINRKKIFSGFLRKRLRKFGLTKTCDEIRKVIIGTLSHALLALQIDRCERSALTRLNDHYYYHLMPLHHKCKEAINNFYYDEESIKFGVHSEAFVRLNLPSFRPLYLYLNNVILDLMHLCIEMQNENKRDIKIQSNCKFSLLSIEVLTNECRECIEQSILVRQFYYHMVYSVFDRNEMDVQTALESDLYKFDEDLKDTINIYLNLITDWVHGLVKIGDLPKALWVLENEWNFCKNNLYFVTASEDIYASRFCTMSSHINESLIHMLNEIDSKYKEPLKEHIYEIEINKHCNSSGINLCDSLKAEDLENLDLSDVQEKEEENSQDFNISSSNSDVDKSRLNLESRLDREDSMYSNDDNVNFNEFKEEINRMRKSCMKALSFFSKFINDLELAAKYEVKSSIQELLNELKISNHVLVLFTNPELNLSKSMIFVPQEFIKDKIQIVRLLFIISEKDEFETLPTLSTSNSAQQQDQQKNRNNVRRLSSSNSFFEINNEQQRNSCLKKLSEFANSVINSGRTSPIHPQTTPNTGPSSAFLLTPNSKNDGYLLYLQLPEQTGETWSWSGPSIELYASVPVRRSLYQHQKSISVSNLILVTSKQSILNEKRTELRKKLKETISLIKEKTSFHPSIDSAIDDLKDNIIQLRKESVKWIKSVEKDLKIPTQDEYLFETKLNMTKIDQRYINEIWRVSYNFGIELQNEILKFMTQDRAEVFSQGLADFSILWCDYIVKNTARGKGRTVRPWAANKGIQLIQQAVHYSVNLKDKEFLDLIKAVEKCILHVIGDRNNNNNNSSNQNTRLSVGDIYQPKSPLNHHHHYHHLTLTDLNSKLVNSHSSLCSTSSKRHNKRLPPRKRFEEACLKADINREKVLTHKRYIGKILDQSKPDYIINGIEVQFRWQLGLLIGEGSYGKVYSCVNLDNGEPMAMKVITFRSNDLNRIKEIADEINNVCDINHENLVKVYGAELHRKEILIFMEFCGDQCTLDRISRDASGLPEKIVRDYTKSLLKAVEHLHEQKIMHRDIKGANIFLKSTDPRHPEKVVLKLGDFGCSIRFKDPIGPGNKEKATGFMGTFAFMAPEVMAISGARDGCYTYSADIWSLGCCVIEMFTGKKPWHPFKDEKILYKVHIECIQQKPTYPTPISDEAINFLNCCLEFDPNKRWGADQLLEHNFVKVIAEDTYQETA